MPWWVNAAIVIWFLVMGVASQKRFFFAAALVWTIGYFIYLMI